MCKDGCKNPMDNFSTAKLSNRLEDFAEQNDFKSAEIVLNESKQYFDQVDVMDKYIMRLCYPAYRLAFQLNHKEFCYRLMLKVSEVTGYYDYESTFFDQSFYSGYLVHLSYSDYVVAKKANRTKYGQSIFGHFRQNYISLAD
ncbi:unnamed protein product [Brachionus calyciflorus]|uniref:Uncharacterized protein n=1 Tax=Brachionus calyciflorus TaxID=104777 RepID=A0A814NIP9_9BILA|nr:unnamed protein product [Brachionus calyciflorus]